MKMRLALFVGCLSFLFSNYAIGYGCNGYSCGKSYYSQRSSGSGCPAENSCECVDPACQEGNSCMSISQCCQAFGNIGR